ncbi:MAG: hypothetical protein PUB97_07500 [Ruminococcus sp.]|nr:hypothetical protein [Ruminococcus sp.]
MIQSRYLIMRNEHIINMSDNGVQTSGNGVNPRGFTPEEVNEIKKKEDLMMCYTERAVDKHPKIW